jgi:hypothetical protein
MLRDHEQAMHTSAIISAAGHQDVCSICGDTPAHDYWLADDASVTIRLCDDCLNIRRTHFSEHFQPIERE